MSFIYRDFATPVKANYNSKIAINNLWKKLAGEVYVGGVRCYNPRIYFRGMKKDTVYNVGVGLSYTEESKKIRSDKDFKRFLKLLGISHDYLSKQSYKDTKSVYFKMEATKLNYSTQTNADILAKINGEYYDHVGIGSVSHPNYKYEQQQSVGALICSLPSEPNKKNTEFYYTSSGHTTSEDGYFNIDAYGNISITNAGILSTANKVQYDGTTNTRSYYIRKEYVVNGTTSYSYETIYLTVKHEYVYVKINVGGQFTKGITSIINQVDYGVPDFISKLPAIRSAIASDYPKYVGNITDIEYSSPAFNPNTITIKGINFSRGVASAVYDTTNGSIYDILALLDDGSCYELDPNIYNEQIALEEVPVTNNFNGLRNTLHIDMDNSDMSTGIYNMEYSYVLRFRIKSKPIVTSKVVTEISRLSNMIGEGISSTELNKTTIANMIKHGNNASEDTQLKMLVRTINKVFDSTIFYTSDEYLRADVVDAMTPNEFALLFKKCFEIGYKAKDTSGGFLSHILAVVIVIVGVALTVFGVLTGNIWLMATSQAFLAISGIVYAKNFNDSWGTKLIGGVTQVNGVVLSIAALVSGYYDLQSQLALTEGVELTTSQQVSIAMSGLEVVGGVGSLAGQFGLIEGDLATGFQIAAGVGALYKAGGKALADYLSKQSEITSEAIMESIKSFSLEPLEKTAFKNVSNFIGLLKQASSIYMNIISLGSAQDMMAEKDQAVKEEGVEAVYLIQEKSYGYDALSEVNDMINYSLGLDRTEYFMSRIY